MPLALSTCNLLTKDKNTQTSRHCVLAYMNIHDCMDLFGRTYQVPRVLCFPLWVLWKVLSVNMSKYDVTKLAYQNLITQSSGSPNGTIVLTTLERVWLWNYFLSKRLPLFIGLSLFALVYFLVTFNFINPYLFFMFFVKQDVPRLTFPGRVLRCIISRSLFLILW